MNTTKQFYLWGDEAEVVIRVKHTNGTTIEVPVSNVTQYVTSPGGSYGNNGEIRIPLRGQWFDKLVETHDFSSFKKGC